MNIDARPRSDGDTCEVPVAHLIQLLHVLANQNRLLLLWLLTEQEACVNDLRLLSGIVQPTLSQQLAVLRRCGAVTTRREGKQIFYRASMGSEVVALAGTVRCFFLGKPTANESAAPKSSP